ncbi:MAG TPA: PAS domain S-box protein [Anaerolineales bacterium]|nr:PAS domain S-box protein [Anaerolineales bacterium]
MNRLIHRILKVARHERNAIQITALYLLIGGFWILFSDKAAAALAANEQADITLSIYKGWFYVLVTGLLLFWLIHRNNARIRKEDEDLRAAEENFKDIFDHATIGIYRSTPDGRLLTVNPELARQFGYDSPEEFLASVDNIAHQVYQNPARRQDFLRQLKERGAVKDFVNQERRKDGSIIWTSTTARVVKDDAGHVLYYEGFNIDINERKQAEEKLIESEERFRSLYENSTIGIYRTTPDGRILLANPALLQMLGYSSFEELAQRDLEEDGYEAGYERSKFRTEIERDGEVRGLESSWTKKDGTPIFIRESAKAVRDPDGKVLYYEGTVEDITDRKRAEEELRENETRFREAIEFLPIPISLADSQENILYFNERFTECYGYTRQDLPTIEAWMIHAYPDPGYRELVQSSWKKRVAESLRDHIATPVREFNVTCKDGSQRNVEIIARVIGSLIIVSFNDVTERRREEEALKESEEKYRRLFEDAVLGIFQSTADGKVIAVNPAFAKIFGYDSPHEVMQAINDVATAIYADPPKRVEVVQRIFESGGPVVMENLYKRKNGELFTGNLHAWLVRDVARKAQFLEGFVEDITERKRAEEQLRASEERYRSLFEDAPVGILLVKTQGEILEVNPAGLQILGSPSAEATKQINFLSFPPLIEAGLSAGLQGALDTRQPVRAEYPYTSKWDKSIFLQVSFTPIFDDNESINQVQIIMDDITERKVAEEALKESEERFSTAFFSSPVAQSIFAQGSNEILAVNDACCNLFGYRREELIGASTARLNLWEDPSSRQAAVEELQATGHLLPREATARLKSGEMRAMIVAIESISWRGIPCLISSIVDISERKRAEEQLRESEALLRMMGHTAKVGGWELNPVTGAGSWTEEVAHIHDLDPLLEPNKQMGIDFYYGDSRLQMEAALKDAIEFGTPYDLEAEIVSAKGRHKWIRTICEPIIENGKVIKLRGSFQDISDRVQIEQQLRESEERFRTFIEQSTDGVAIYDEQGRIVEWNQAQAEITGIPRDRAIGTPVWQVQFQLLVPEHRSEERFEQLKNALLRALQSGQSPEFGKVSEVEIQAAGGPRRAITQSVFPIKTENGLRMGSIVRDRTEQQKAQKALHESETRYRGIFEGVQDAIFVEDTNYEILDVNQRACEMYGYTREEFQKKAVQDLVPSEDYFIRFDEKELSGAGIGPIETVNVRANGESFPVELSGRLWAIGNQRLILIILRDITERKRAEDALREHEGQLRALVTSLDDIVFEADEQGTYLNVWTADESLLVQPKAKLLGQQISDALPKGIAQQVEEAIGRALTDRKVGEVDYPLDLPNGRHWFLARINPIPSPDASRRTVSLLVRDITERKKAEHQIQTQVERLTALKNIDQIISTNFDLQVSLEMLLAQVANQLKVDAADVLILNPAMNQLEFRAGRGFYTRAYENALVRLGESYAGRAALERSTIYIANLKTETNHPSLNDFVTAENFTSYFGVPLISKGQIKGVLEVFHRSSLHPAAEWLDFLETLAQRAAIAVDNIELFFDLQRSNNELMLAYDATIEGWSRAMDLRDEETEGHTKRVVDMTMKLAVDFGFSGEMLMHIRRGALLHDIGKLGVPDNILLKPDTLTDEEWIVMKKHPTFAFEMLSSIQYLNRALNIPYCHHEKWDGTGYPRGLRGEQIPLEARIFAVVDVWDAITSDRPYRKAWAKGQAMEHIRTLAGTHFDPVVVERFLDLQKREFGRR